MARVDSCRGSTEEKAPGLILFLGSRWTESPRCRRRRRREKRRDSLSRYQRQSCQQIATGDASDFSGSFRI